MLARSIAPRWPAHRQHARAVAALPRRAARRSRASPTPPIHSIATPNARWPTYSPASTRGSATPATTTRTSAATPRVARGLRLPRPHAPLDPPDLRPLVRAARVITLAGDPPPIHPPIAAPCHCASACSEALARAATSSDLTAWIAVTRRLLRRPTVSLRRYAAPLPLHEGSVAAPLTADHSQFRFRLLFSILREATCARSRSARTSTRRHPRSPACSSVSEPLMCPSVPSIW